MPSPLRCLADVIATAPLWLWPGRIPRGTVTMLVGDPGRGKSLLALDMAARVTTGRGWPDAAGDDVADDPGDVLLLTAEDSLSRTVRARLLALGADLRRVHYLNAGLWRDGSQADPHLCPDRIEAPTAFGYVPTRAFYALRHDAKALKSSLAALPECRLVVIDPITAYLHAGDEDDFEEARLHIAPLATLADSSGAAIVVVAHRDGTLGGQSDRRRQQLRALATMARAIHLVDRMPSDPRRVFAPVKSNLAEPKRPLAFTIATEFDGGATLQWSTAPIEVTADELLAGAMSHENVPRRGALEIDRAVAWLQGALAAGPVASRDLIARAAEVGISDRLLKRARERLGVTAAKHGTQQGCWLCNLPPKSENKEGGQVGGMVPLVPLVSFPQEGSSADECTSEPPSPNVDPTVYNPKSAA